MQVRQAFVHRLPCAAPDDMSALHRALTDATIDPAGVVAVLGKTEGNGCVNDFTRAFAVRAIRDTLAAFLPAGAVDAVSTVMSGGTEGGLSPHLLVLERRPTDRVPDQPSLAIGSVHTADLPFHALGRRDQVRMVADGVRAAMADAGIVDPADVHFVQIKCPLLTAARIAEAEAASQSTATRDTLKSMGLSRGASALGVAVALGEVALDAITDADIGRNFALSSSRASTSGGVELLNHEIVVIGMSALWSGDLAVDHAVMADSIDILPVRDCLRRLGFAADGQLTVAEQTRLVALLAKAEAGTSGSLRGRRHTMLDDSDISSTRHARAFVAGVLSSLVGHAEIFVSGGAEHQGPDGGGPVAIIASRSGACP
ncbi:ring-opening amidohydrolase [Oryzibacter oryziterrae]|uniref:cyanuric acid amidohydrolase n=1 Tax=Oryzibacter oryziterrae TaxID=2766474 RepID=UPI001F0153AA|nr:ring-opening amidohydrolase [Oryzibacter oryziterrae]